VEHFASIFYFAFPSEERFASLFYYFLRAKGVHVLEGFPCFLTTTHTDADIEKVFAAFKESVADMQNAGFFSKAGTVVDSIAAVASSQSVSAPVTKKSP